MESLSKACDDLKNIELLIKFDDDQDIKEALEIIDENKSIIDIKYIVTPRGKGYQDLPNFYLDLFFKLNPNCKIITVHSIDLFFNKRGFDTVLIDSVKNYEDGIFVVHPCITPSFKSKVTTINDAVQWVDGFPAWSRKWLEIQGRFGHNALTDGWTQLTEFFLFNEFGIDRRIDISHHNFFSEIDNVDRSVKSQYWQVKRREAIEHHLSKTNIDLARQNAKNIMLNILNYECLKKGQQNNESITVYHQYLIKSALNAYDDALINEQKLHLEHQKLSSVIAQKDQIILDYQNVINNYNNYRKKRGLKKILSKIKKSFRKKIDKFL